MSLRVWTRPPHSQKATERFCCISSSEQCGCHVHSLSNAETHRNCAESHSGKGNGSGGGFTHLSTKCEEKTTYCTSMYRFVHQCSIKSIEDSLYT